MMEMIKIRIPVSEFTVSADAEGVFITFRVQPELMLFESDKKPVFPAPSVAQCRNTAVKKEKKEDWFEKVLTNPDKTNEQVKCENEKSTPETPSVSDNPDSGLQETHKTKRIGKQLPVGKYKISKIALSAAVGFVAQTGTSKKKITECIATKLNVSSTALYQSLWDRKNANAETVNLLAEIIGRKITLQKDVKGQDVWSIDAEAEAEAGITAPEESTDTAPAFLSTGLIELIDSYLESHGMKHDFFYHEVAVKLGISKMAAQKIIIGDAQVHPVFLPWLKELLKVDIVRIENEDGTAYWEGV